MREITSLTNSYANQGFENVKYVTERDVNANAEDLALAVRLLAPVGKFSPNVIVARRRCWRNL